MISLISYIKGSLFIKNFATYMSGGVFAKVIALATFVYIGKLLSPEKYAQFTLFLIVVGLLSVFGSFGLQSGMLRIIWEDKRIVLTNSLFILTVFSFLLAFFVFVFGDFFLNFLPISYEFLSDFKIFISIKIFINAFNNVLSAFYVSIEKPIQFVKVNIFSVMINLLLLITITSLKTVADNFEILWIVICVQTIAGLVAVIFGLYISMDYLKISSISLSKSISILKQTFVFFIKNLIGFMQMYSSQIILSVMAASYLFGVYSFYMDVLIQLSFLTSIFDKVYIPKIRNLVLSVDQQQKKHANYLVNKTVKIYACLSVLLFLLMGPVLYVFMSYSAIFHRIIQPAYLENLHLFYFMFFAWLIGNLRSFFEVWQYIQNSQVNKHLIFIHLILLFALYFGSIFFYNLFGVYGIIMNQILVTLMYLTYSFSCYRKFVLEPAKI